MRNAARPWRRVALAVAALGILTACTVQPGQFVPGAQPNGVTGEDTAPFPPGLIAAEGVTKDPCPNAVNPDNGCIYLGALVDESGPFSAFGKAALAGVQAYWHHVNELGGVRHETDDGVPGRFDVDVTKYVEDNRYNVPTHLEAYDKIKSHVVGLAMSFGTPTTSAALDDYIADDMVAVPMGWWSGWNFEPLIAQTGASACFQAINGMDWARAQLGGSGSIDHVVVVAYPGRYGEDTVAGVQRWTDPAFRGAPDVRVPFVPAEHVVEVEPGGDVSAAVDKIVEVSPQVAVLATGPKELAAIAKQTAAKGWRGLIVGMAPTFEPSLLDDPAVADVLTHRYYHIATVGPLTQGGKAYRDMRGDLGLPEKLSGNELDASKLPANGAWIAGWVSQYPLREGLKEAIKKRDLTRAGLAEAIQETKISYEGALPDTRYGDDPTEHALRRVFVMRPDRNGPMGEVLAADAYVGNTTEHVQLARPCTEH